MSRWHKLDCPAPTVCVDKAGATPTCRTCSSAPNLEDIINHYDQEITFAGPPPDQPRGKMNLWWPPSVPYRAIEGLSNNSDNGEDDDGDEAVPGSERMTARQDIQAVEDVKDAVQSPIYGEKALMTGEFRLACVSPATAVDDQIHLDLETYSFDNCPEYETASYCWAGEDGDSRRQLPVYVGPYWDVALQTRNCWELLRHVRPHRGIRLIWVDALCINQACQEERDAQVAQMRRIYSEGTQVVVYLGPDVAHTLPPGRYPRRHKLEEFGIISRVNNDAEPSSATGVIRDIDTLLRRRYFSRLWVIQELILSPRVVMRIGDIDFWTDRKANGGLWSEHQGLTAPWVTHLAKGAPLELSLLEVMHLTFSAGCADPRDHLFGLMGVVSGSNRASILLPDYSLSSQHVFIGLFAHLFITRDLQRLLAHGSGLMEPCLMSLVPSWVPDWTRWDSWRALQVPTEVSGNRIPMPVHPSRPCRSSDQNRLSRSKRQMPTPGCRY